ncbi:MAG: hypothetical protein AB8G05_17790 [Oligoflexales bacterium]
MYIYTSLSLDTATSMWTIQHELYDLGQNPPFQERFSLIKIVDNFD